MSETEETKFIKEIMNLWLIPEIEKRKKNGAINKDFKITKAQIIFSLDRGWNKVRFNDEVKAIAKCKINKDKKAGETINEEDISDIEKIELTDKDSNCAHITMIKFKDGWKIAFDFRYNKKRILEHIEASKEFLESAKENLNKNRLRPFFENSFACAELLAKSILLILPNKKILEGKNHKERTSLFEDWAKLGNVKKQYSTCLCRLVELRPSARYLCSTAFKKEDPNSILKDLEAMLKFAEENIE